MVRGLMTRLALCAITVLLREALAVEDLDLSRYPLRAKHHHLLSKLSHYELVRPYRSTQDGTFLSNDLSTAHEEAKDDFDRARRRRSAFGHNDRHGRPESTTLDDPRLETEFHFCMDAFGARLRLNVTRNRYLVSPMLRVEVHGRHGIEKELQTNKRCFYTGTVIDDPESSVAISNCDGLSGSIVAYGEEYVIEPLLSTVGQSNVSAGHLHVMYRAGDFKMESTRLETDFKMGARPNKNGLPRTTDKRTDQRERSRRGTSDQDDNSRYFVETLLVGDHSMVEFHGIGDLPTYLLTMLNIVNRIYKHGTMKVNIRFTATRIIILDKDLSESLVQVRRYRQSLRNVMQWLSTIAPTDKMPGNKIQDYASFVTKTDFGPAGFAPISAMCAEFWSCSISFEEGLTSSFIMAHEAGHVLGMEHDGDSNSCVQTPFSGSIMSPLVVSNYGYHHWSNCSVQELRSNLGYFTCLHDLPSEGTFHHLQGRYPGERYSLDDQCTFFFDKSSRQCNMESVSSACLLRCSYPGDLELCYEYDWMALDGTPCGNDQWCRKGNCVRKPQKRHGRWSKWSAWGECSYDCGVGVKTRQRMCNKPKPMNGGDYCRGKSFGFKICNTQPCPAWVTTDRRAEQCTDHLSTVLYRGKLQVWLPHVNTDGNGMHVVSESPQCHLTCITAKSHAILGTPYRVTDGTPCTYDDRHSVCVRGQCIHLGCDKRAGSDKTDDRCGTCGGDNSACVHVQKVFSKSPKHKYHRIATLPTGAYDIHVREQTNTTHFLSLRREADNSCILNADGSYTGLGEFIGGGARFVYSRADDHLTSAGPLGADLVLLIYWTEDPGSVNVTYSYYLHSGYVTE